jgi:hypothetical protein
MPDVEREPDEHLELWGREVDHEDFMQGHYAGSRRTPTPEGGQAGIAQGNAPESRERDAETFAERDQFSTSQPRAGDAEGTREREVEA